MLTGFYCKSKSSGLIINYIWWGLNLDPFTVQDLTLCTELKKLIFINIVTVIYFCVHYKSHIVVYFDQIWIGPTNRCYPAHSLIRISIFMQFSHFLHNFDVMKKKNDARMCENGRKMLLPNAGKHQMVFVRNIEFWHSWFIHFAKVYN